jgi:catechol 2,3-dioxygenase-like lactoylglutathione lyase family enzyme
MPIAHVSLPTGPSKYEEMRDFYTAILAPLGYKKFMEIEGKTYGMGPKNGSPDFWIHSGPKEMDAFDGDLVNRGARTHVCFLVNSTREVHEWHAAAV